MAQKTSPQMIATAERRAYVLNLRKMGATYEQIARQTIERFGADRLPKGFDHAYAAKDVMREIEKLQDSAAHDAYIIRYLWMERLDRLLASLWPLAVGNMQQTADGELVGRFPDMPAIDRVLKISERQAKLAGADQLPEGAENVPLMIIVDR